FELGLELPGQHQAEHADIALERPGRVRNHGRAIVLDEEMPGPGEEVADAGPDQRDHGAHGEEARDQPQRADPRSDDMQEPRPTLRMVAEIMQPKILEAFLLCRHRSTALRHDTLTLRA